MHDEPTYAEIPELPRIPVWDKHLYRGAVTLLVGEGGCGKGLTGVDLAARVTTGAPRPGESEDTPHAPASVIMVNPEDDPNEDMAGRLRAAGADLEHVYDMTEDPDGNPFCVTDVSAIAELIERLSTTDHPVRVVILDPLMAMIEKTIASNLMARRAMAPIMRLAKKTGVAVLIIHHLTKDGKVSGSKGLTDVMRYVYTVSKDPNVPGQSVVTLEKGNNLGDVPDLRYEIGVTNGQPVVKWIEGTSRTVAPPWRKEEDQERDLSYLDGLEAFDGTASKDATVTRLLVLLSHAKRPLPLDDLAREAEVDTPGALRLLKKLEQAEQVQHTASGWKAAAGWKGELLRCRSLSRDHPIWPPGRVGFSHAPIREWRKVR